MLGACGGARGLLYACWRLCTALQDVHWCRGLFHKAGCCFAAPLLGLIGWQTCVRPWGHSADGVFLCTCSACCSTAPSKCLLPRLLHCHCWVVARLCAVRVGDYAIIAAARVAAALLSADSTCRPPIFTAHTQRMLLRGVLVITGCQSCIASCLAGACYTICLSLFQPNPRCQLPLQGAVRACQEGVGYLVTLSLPCMTCCTICCMDCWCEPYLWSTVVLVQCMWGSLRRAWQYQGAPGVARQGALMPCKEGSQTAQLH